MSKQNVDLQRITSSQNIHEVFSQKSEGKIGLGSLLKSLWGWGKQPPVSLSTSQDTITERDFSGYLTDVGEGIGRLKKTMSNKSKRKQKEEIKSVEESIAHIPRPFFSEQSGVYLGKLNSKAEVRREQQRLNDYLDTIEICLFRQINTRFADFFNMLENIEYLEKAVHVNISILAQTRSSIRKVEDMCRRRVASILTKQVVLENRRKVLHVLNLLRQIKANESMNGGAIGTVGQLHDTFRCIRELKSLSQVTVQLSERASKAGSSISKNIFGRVVSYLSVPLSSDMLQKMRDVPCPTTTDGEEIINETVMLGESRIDGPTTKPPPVNDPTVEKQLGRVLEQVSASIDVKEVAADWKHFITVLELFQREFLNQLSVVVVEAVTGQNARKSILQELDGSTLKEQSAPLPQPSADLLLHHSEKVSMVYYGRLIECYHNCLRSVVVRLVGLLGEFMQQIYKMGIDEPLLFAQMMSFLQALLSFIADGIFTLITKKQLASDCQLVEFHSYIGPLLFWEVSLRELLESKLFLLDYCHASDKVSQTKEHTDKCLARLRQAVKQFQTKYIDRIHRIIVNEELRQSLKDEPWVAANNIPFNYMPIIYYILYGESKEQNVSILNDSLFDERSRRDLSILTQNRKRTDFASYRNVDFKLLRNAIIVGRRHYRVNVCFLTFVEILEEYLKIQDLYTELKEQVMGKIAEVIEVYSAVSYEMIVCGGALKLDKIKAKIITARHLCLSWSCLRLIDVFVASLVSDRIEQARQTLKQHTSQIVRRLSGLIRGKTNQEITNLLKVDLAEQPCPASPTVAIVSAYKQMLEILQDHMPEDVITEVMRETVDLFMTTLVQYLQQKQERGTQELRFFLWEMKVMEVGFKTEYSTLQQLIPEQNQPAPSAEAGVDQESNSIVVHTQAESDAPKQQQP